MDKPEMPLPELPDLQATAQRMLAGRPDPVVRYRLMRDVLQVPPDYPELINAHSAIAFNPHVQLLISEQQADGGWGAFHSRSTKSKQRMHTTEFAVERALALGLDAQHPVLKRTAAYLKGLLADPARFPDTVEHNDRWATGVRLFVAATLAQIEPDCPALRPVRGLWIELVRRTFSGGVYSAAAEEQAHRELTGASIRGFYLELQNRYSVALLATASKDLAMNFQKAYLDWLFSLPGGMHYLEECLSGPPPLAAAGRLDRWLRSFELLACWPAARPYCAAALAKLAAERGTDGCWDLGKRGSASSCLPLSATWRKAGARTADWTARLLILLARSA